MECYEGAKMIKTFRGLIADGGQDTILLHTNDGSIGYRIVRFDLFAENPGQYEYEHVMKVYKVQQTTIDNNVNFGDNTLLAAAFLQDGSASYYPEVIHVTFDKEIFNQDIYVTHVDTAGNLACNYYIELEQVKLDLNSNTVATLKDMRNTASPRP